MPSDPVDVAGGTDRSFARTGCCEGSFSTPRCASAEKQRSFLFFLLLQKTLLVTDQVTHITDWLRYISPVFLPRQYVASNSIMLTVCAWHTRDCQTAPNFPLMAIYGLFMSICQYLCLRQRNRCDCQLTSSSSEDKAADFSRSLPNFKNNKTSAKLNRSDLTSELS